MCNAVSRSDVRFGAENMNDAFLEEFKALRQKGISIWQIFNNFNSNETNKQRFRIASGRLWESIVLDYLNNELQYTQVRIVRGSELQQKYPKIYKYVTQFQKRKCQQDMQAIFPDTDLMAIDIKNQVGLAILSCKTSLRERGVLQSIAWKFMMQNIPLFLVTVDRGSGVDGVSELGTCNNPKKNRVLAETFLDAVYVPMGREGLDFCTIVKPFEKLPDDLVKMTESRKRTVEAFT